MRPSLKVFFCFRLLVEPVAQGVSASVHQPAAGPMKRTVTQSTTIPPIPIQAPRVVTAMNCCVWLRVSGSQDTTRGEVSAALVLALG